MRWNVSGSMIVERTYGVQLTECHEEIRGRSNTSVDYR